MPFDPTLPLKVRSPEYHSPLDSYARFLTLREMMDRRQFADQQRQWQSEDRQRMQSLRDLLSTNPNPTWGDIARYDIGTANAYIKSQSEIAKERELALKAKLDAAGKAQEIAATTKETAFNELAGIQAIADPDAKGQAFMEWMGKYQGLGFPRQAGWPMNEQTMEFIGKSGLGPDKWNTLQANAAKAKREEQEAALKRSKDQIDLAGHYLGTVNDQPSYDRWRSMIPPELQAVLGPTYTPDTISRAKSVMLTPQQRAQAEREALPNNPDELVLWMNQPGRTPEEIARGKTALEQMTTYHQAIRPAMMNTGGLVGAVMQNPELWQNLSAEAKSTIAPQLAALGFKGFGTTNTELQKRTTALKDLDDSMRLYRSELEKVGPTFQPEKGAQLNTYYKSLMLRAKELFNLGVLNGPDLAILESTLSDPSQTKANIFLGTSGLLKQLDAFETIINKSRANLQSTYHPGAPTTPDTAPPSPPTSGGTTRNIPVTEVMPGQVTVTAPNGKTYVFPNATAADGFKKRSGIK